MRKKKMNHRVGFNKLGLKESHRKALHRNMATSLFRYERITTTKSKATAVKRTVEKMITRAKVDSVHNRRLVARDIKDKEILAKIFTDIAPRNENRPGGYTRVLKLGTRQGDAADMVILELVDKEGGSSDKDKTPKKTKKASNKNEKKVEKAVTEATEAVVAEEAPVNADAVELETETK
jgi:large subunit ribosomal protein L17